MTEADRLLNEADGALRSGLLQEAETLYRRVTALAPGKPQALFGLAQIRLQAGDIFGALRLARQCVARKPNFAAARILLGNMLLATGAREEAAEQFRESLALEPDTAEARFGLANVALAGDAPDLEEAVRHLRQVIALQPDAFEAYMNLADTLRKMNDLEGAEPLARRAIDLRPTAPEPYSALGAILQLAGRDEEALMSHRRAVALAPESCRANHDLSVCLYQRNDLAGATQYAERAAALEPENPRAQYLLWNVLLHAGDYAAGWKTSRNWWNMRPESRLRRFDQPEWSGDAQPGRTLLVYADKGPGQGFGDSILLSRFLPGVKQKFGGRVIFECPRALVGLMSSLPGVDQVVPRTEAPPQVAFDVRIRLMDLPWLLDARLDALPLPAAISVLEERVAAWAARLPERQGLRIGACWTGDRENEWNAMRSCSLEDFGVLASIPGIQFVSLQTGFGAEQAQTPPSGMALFDASGDLTDFTETAALIRNLDLVISIDTAVAHLAGALGMRAWTLLAFENPWIWLAQREDSPWYPSARLFRQSTRGDWAEVFKRVAEALRTQMG